MYIIKDREGKVIFEGECLSGANLYGANLSWVDLKGADLRWANLKGAYLIGSDLYGANLRGSDLRGAALLGAHLYGANLRGSDLRGSDLRGSDLRGSDLRGAYLEGTFLPDFLIVPKEGEFFGYKATTKGVVRLLITEDSQRVNAISSRKCRASKVIPISGTGLGGTGTHSEGITYNEGQVVETEFDPDIRLECTKGIHFFMTKEEATSWCEM